MLGRNCFPNIQDNCFLFYGNQVSEKRCFIVAWYKPPTCFCFLLLAMLHRATLHTQRYKISPGTNNDPWTWPTGVFRHMSAFLPRVQSSIELSFPAPQTKRGLEDPVELYLLWHGMLVEETSMSEWVTISSMMLLACFRHLLPKEESVQQWGFSLVTTVGACTTKTAKVCLCSGPACSSMLHHAPACSIAIIWSNREDGWPTPLDITRKLKLAKNSP